MPVSEHVYRAAYAVARHAAALVSGASPGDICRSLWPDDKITPAVLKADTLPSDTSGWASDPASTIGMEFLRGLPSAAAALIGRGVSFPQVPGIMRLPRQVAGPISAPWVQEGAPIRVASDGVDTILLPEPKKLGVILALTRELYKKPAARAVTDALLRESAVKSIDAAYFSADAASDAGHAGLLWDATDLGVGTNLVEDLELAARSVASGLAPVLFVLSPGRREQAVIRLPDIAPNVIASSAIADDTLVAVDPSAFAHSVGAPDISASREAAIHMSTVPLELVSGVPATADPIRSALQTDTIVLRLLLDISYAARRTGAVAKMTIGWY